MKRKKIILIILIIVLIFIVSFLILDKYVGNVFDLHPPQ